MTTWPVQDAKVRFSELLDACVNEGPQMLTRHGTKTAVLVPIAEWQRLQIAARPSLKQLLLIDSARTENLVPEHISTNRVATQQELMRLVPRKPVKSKPGWIS